VVDREELAVFVKPHDVPTVATADNAVENALAALEETHGRRFFVTHRLDTGAAGLLVVAKTEAAQAALDRAFRERAVEKIYRALAPEGLSPGPQRHFLAPGAPPRRASADPIPDGEDAELVVEGAEPFAKDRYPKAVAEYRIRLVTGRTHQIRAQFAALEKPLVGDKTYGGKGSLPRPFPRRAFALVATELRWNDVRAEIAPTWRD
jgi:23S rRNA-/tRNA-specific pseudouridylate synthase